MRRPVARLSGMKPTFLAMSAALALHVSACSHETRSETAATSGAKAQDDEDDDPNAPPTSAAKLTEEEARAAALAEVSGDVVASELEREHGHLIYSIEIRPTGQTSGIREVNVDAIDGSIVGIEDEQDDAD